MVPKARGFWSPAARGGVVGRRTGRGGGISKLERTSSARVPATVRGRPPGNASPQRARATGVRPLF
eukprot:8867058-Lingulodinium_polyedra.AAC.1